MSRLVSMLEREGWTKAMYRLIGRERPIDKKGNKCDAETKLRHNSAQMRVGVAS